MMIVTELLPLGDFKGLLYSKELDLSLFTRVRMMTGFMNFSLGLFSLLKKKRCRSRSYVASSRRFCCYSS